MSDYLQNLFIDEVKGLLNGGSAGNLEEKIAELVGSAPENLDTLEELAKALNNVTETINKVKCAHFEYDSETGNLYYVTEE